MLGPKVSKNFGDVLTRAVKIVHTVARHLEHVPATALRPTAPLRQLVEALERVEAGPPVAGYEAVLLKNGCPAFEALLIAYLIQYCGEALKRENDAERCLASGLRAIAKVEGKSTIVITRRAKALRDRLGSSCVQAALGRACTKAGRPNLAVELSKLIENAADRDPAACHAILIHAACLLPHLPDPRGRPLNLATAKHELLIEELHHRGRPRAFTWSPVEANFLDPATQATRTAVGNPSFDPRYAARRWKHHIAESS
jgi:hypothetical protein